MTASQILRNWAIWAFSPATSAILVTVIISLLSPILIHFWLYRKAPSAELPTFVVVGTSGAGKTSLQTLLAYGQPSSTRTSQTPQSALCTLSSNIKASEDRYRSENDNTAHTRPQYVLLDTPGHGKLRHYSMTAISAPANPRGVIFMIDSAAIGSPTKLAETAEYLHDVLLTLQKQSSSASSSKAPNSLAVLIAANKQDVFTSLPPEVIVQRVEKEIGRIRQSKSSGLLHSGSSATDDAIHDDESSWLGEYGSKEFSFEQLVEYGVIVDVAGGSVKNGDTNKSEVNSWLQWLGHQL